MFKGDVIQEYQVEKWIKFLDCLEKSDVTDIVRIISIMPKVLSAIFTHTFYAGYTSDLVIYYNLVALSPLKVAIKLKCIKLLKMLSKFGLLNSEEFDGSNEKAAGGIPLVYSSMLEGLKVFSREHYSYITVSKIVNNQVHLQNDQNSSGQTEPQGYSHLFRDIKMYPKVIQ